MMIIHWPEKKMTENSGLFMKTINERFHDTIKHVLTERRSFIYSFIPLLFLLITGIISLYFHDTFEEFDGIMLVLVGREIFAGKGYGGWTAISWPPLFSVIVGFLDLFIDGFTAGKIVSVLAGTLILLLIPVLARELGLEAPRGILLVQLAVALNPLFLILSIIVENHQLEALFLVASTILLIKMINHKHDITHQLDHATFQDAWRQSPTREAWMLGITMALACLTRYTSYVLLPVTLLTLLAIAQTSSTVRHDWQRIARRIGKLTLLVFTPFLIISLPWYVANTLENGWFLASSAHLNIGFAVIEHLHRRWWWKTMANYGSLLDIIKHHPVAYLANFIHNILSLPGEFIYLMGWFLPLTVLSFWHGLQSRKTKGPFIIILSILGLYTIGISQAFYLDELFIIHIILLTVISITIPLKLIASLPDTTKYDEKSINKIVSNEVWLAHLFMIILLLLDIVIAPREGLKLDNNILLFLIVYFPIMMLITLAFRFSRYEQPKHDVRTMNSFLIKKKNRMQRMKKFSSRFSPFSSSFIFLLMLLLPLGYSMGSIVYRTTEYLEKQSEDNGSLANFQEVASFLKAYDPNLSEKYLMAGHPGYSYYSNAKFLKLPSYFEGTLEELVYYGGLNQKIIDFSPKYPSHPRKYPLIADYLIFNRHNTKFLPRFRFLLDPSSGKNDLPPSFTLIYRTEDVVIYQINQNLLFKNV